MTTHNKDKIIAAAKDLGVYFGGDGNPPEWIERFYTIAHEAGAASRDAEIDQLRAELEYDQRNAAMSQSESARLLDENTKLRAELVKALAACKGKDEALEQIADDDYDGSPIKIAKKARSIQPDTSALEAIVKKVDGLVRERAAKTLLNGNFLHDQAPGALLAREAAKAIRELPAVTLDDLKGGA